MKKAFIIGGLGHIGLTLAAVISKYHDVYINDVNKQAIEKFNKEKKAMFYEPGLDELLGERTNIQYADLEFISKSDFVVVTIGTPIDEYQNPILRPIFILFREILPYLTNQTIILRSTICPGITKKIERILPSTVRVAFCPERVAGGSMVDELQKLPQIISANSQEAIDSACGLFAPLGIPLKILYNTTAGELSKLFANSYRYIHFAIANQFFMMAKNAGLDFYSIYDAMTDEYPRLKNLPKPFWTSGYCLHKDSIQLASWQNGNTFNLAYDASIVNEYLPLFVFRKMRDKFGDLSDKTIGLLGMAFKDGTDDTRDSLSFRMIKILENEVKQILCSDPYVNLPFIFDVDFVIKNSDIIILMTNHKEYSNLKIEKPTIDLINFFGNGDGL